MRGSGGILGGLAEHSCIWYIRNLRFFPQLDEISLEEIASRSKMLTARRGDRITVKTTAAGYAYLVKEGHLRVMRTTGEGRSIALDILEPGDVIGITPIITEDADADSAEALDDVLFCRLPATKLREALEQNPGLALHFTKRFGLRKRTLETRLADIAFCTVKVRLARLLLELLDRFGQPHAIGTVIKIRLTHQELGELVGANREAANRAAIGLVDQGILRFVGKQIAVIDREALLREANFGFDWRNVSIDTQAE